MLCRLLSSTAYRTRIRFTNDFGQSQWSPESAWMKTLESAPSSAPSNIEAIPYESSTLKIHWRPPPIYAWNSDYVGYRILYRPYPSNDTYKTEEIALSGERLLQMERVISGLDRYVFIVMETTHSRLYLFSFLDLNTIFFVCKHSINRVVVPVQHRHSSMSAMQFQNCK